MTLSNVTKEPLTGMAQAIYVEMEKELGTQEPQEPPLPPKVLSDLQKTWAKLSYAIAVGVVASLKKGGGGDTEFAESFSSSAEDAAFWGWFSEFIGIFKTWSEGPGDIVALKTKLKEHFQAKSIPGSMKGVIK